MVKVPSLVLSLDLGSPSMKADERRQGRQCKHALKENP